MTNSKNKKKNPVQIPLYRRIAEEIGGKIVNNEIRPGEKLPSERQVANHYKASRATVRTALAHLEQEGLITRRDRRSAIVAIKRDIAPNVRIACSSSGIISLLRQLADKQLLPARSQLQLIDMRQPGSVGALMTQPASGADILICELEHIDWAIAEHDIFAQLAQSAIGDVKLHQGLQKSFIDNKLLTAVPIGVWPMVLYYNKAILGDKKAEIPQSPWHWDQLAQIAQSICSEGVYGFQIRPCFGHLSAIISSFGGEFYQADGAPAAKSSTQFEVAIRFIHDLLHVSKVAPPLVCDERVNLFADRRCGIAIDGFDMFNSYRQKLGDDLGVAVLPGAKSAAGVTGGYCLLTLKTMDVPQTTEELLRNLLNNKTQKIMAQIGSALPVRDDMLDKKVLRDVGLPAEAASVFVNELGAVRKANLPGSLQQKNNVEALLLELWLNLDTIENICRRFKQL